MRASERPTVAAEGGDPSGARDPRPTAWRAPGDRDRLEPRGPRPARKTAANWRQLSIDGTHLITRPHPEACSSHDIASLAREVLDRCDRAASFTEATGRITRTFLCEAMRRLHEEVTRWMNAAGMDVHLDAAGNLIGHYEGSDPSWRVHIIGSHLDTVPDAGKYDGVLGVMLGIAAVQALEVEGCRSESMSSRSARKKAFATALRSWEAGRSAGHSTVGCWIDATERAFPMAEAFRAVRSRPGSNRRGGLSSPAHHGYLEVHIEQGPVLESLDMPLGVVEGIAGQSRLWVTLDGPRRARRHAADGGPAGCTRRGGRAGARGRATGTRVAGLRATVGSLSVCREPSMSCPGRRGFASTSATRTMKPRWRRSRRFVDVRRILGIPGVSRLPSRKKSIIRRSRLTCDSARA